MTSKKQPPRCGIYCIRLKDTSRYYVGQSVDIDKRSRGHKQKLRRGKHHSPKLQNAWNKYGEDAFEFFVLEISERDKDILCEREQYWMDELKAVGQDGFNICPAAGSHLGVKRSAETRAKLSAAWNGRIVTPETRSRMAKSMLGNKNRLGSSPTEETRAKLSASKKGNIYGLGYRHTSGALVKISTSKKGNTYFLGRKHSEETKTKMSINRAAAWIRQKDNQQSIGIH